MLDWLRYRRDLARLRKQYAKDLKALHNAYAAAQKQNKTISEANELRDKWLDKFRDNQDRIALLETEYLTSQARKHLVPMPKVPAEIYDGAPDPSGKWRCQNLGFDCLLTDEAVRELRRELRADRRERLEIVRSWVAGLTGLIGVIIGLLAIILGRR